MYPSVALFEISEEQRRGSTTFVSRVTLPSGLPADLVEASLAKAVAAEPILRGQIRRRQALAVDEPESWWDAFELIDRDTAPALSIEYVDEFPNRILPPSDGVAVRFEGRVDERGAIELRLISRAAVFDAHGEQLFWDRLSATLMTGNRPDVADPRPIFAKLRAEWAAGEWSQSKAYWNRRASGTPPTLPVGSERSAWPITKSIHRTLSEAAISKLHEAQITSKGTKLAVFTSIVQRACERSFGWTDVPFHLPYANRHRPETREALAHFANVVPLATRTATVAAVDEISAQLFALARHGHYPTELRLAETPELLAQLQGEPIVLVRLMDLGAGAYEREIPTDVAGSSFGHPVCLSFDLLQGRRSVALRISYRADKVGADAMAVLEHEMSTLIGSDFGPTPTPDHQQNRRCEA